MINHLDVNSVKITFYSEKETIGGKRDDNHNRTIQKQFIITIYSQGCIQNPVKHLR